MDKRILEKLKDQVFAGDLAKAEDVTAVKKLFSDEGISATDSDVNEIGSLFQGVAEKLQQMPEDEINKISGGIDDGFVHRLSDKLSSRVSSKASFEPKSYSEKFYNKVYYNSDKIVEGTLAAALIAGTVGTMKLYKYASKKGWWLGSKK